MIRSFATVDRTLFISNTDITSLIIYLATKFEKKIKDPGYMLGDHLDFQVVGTRGAINNFKQYVLGEYIKKNSATVTLSVVNEIVDCADIKKIETFYVNEG